MIVGLTPVKVGHRQANYTKTSVRKPHRGFFMPGKKECYGFIGQHKLENYFSFQNF